MRSRKDASICRLLTALGVFGFSFSSVAAELWFYERLAPAVDAATARVAWPRERPGDKHWALAEFDSDPYADELRQLETRTGFQKASVLFKRPPAPLLAESYIRLARAWKSARIETQYKFVGTLPTEQEAAILKPVCELGVRIFFITNTVPTAYEAANLKTLESCVRVDFALNRYPRYQDVPDLKRLQGLELGFVNDYFPAYQHVDILNIVDTPVRLQIRNTAPDAEQVGLLNQLKRLAGVFLDFGLYPTEEQYAALRQLDRSPERPLSLRWGYGTPRDTDLRAWSGLRVDRVQVPLDTLARDETERALRALPGEVIVETFPVVTAVR